MSQGFEIQIFNHYKNKMDIEKVYGDDMVKFAYGNPIGRLLARLNSDKLVTSRPSGHHQRSCRFGRAKSQAGSTLNIYV